MEFATANYLDNSIRASNMQNSVTNAQNRRELNHAAITQAQNVFEIAREKVISASH